MQILQCVQNLFPRYPQVKDLYYELVLSPSSLLEPLVSSWASVKRVSRGSIPLLKVDRAVAVVVHAPAKLEEVACRNWTFAEGPSWFPVTKPHECMKI